MRENQFSFGYVHVNVRVLPFFLTRTCFTRSSYVGVVFVRVLLLELISLTFHSIDQFLVRRSAGGSNC
jgi:hypothetical protein